MSLVQLHTWTSFSVCSLLLICFTCISFPLCGLCCHVMLPLDLTCLSTGSFGVFSRQCSPVWLSVTLLTSTFSACCTFLLRHIWVHDLCSSVCCIFRAEDYPTSSTELRIIYYIIQFLQYILPLTIRCIFLHKNCMPSLFGISWFLLP